MCLRGKAKRKDVLDRRTPRGRCLKVHKMCVKMAAALESAGGPILNEEELGCQAKDLAFSQRSTRSLRRVLSREVMCSREIMPPRKKLTKGMRVIHKESYNALVKGIKQAL